MNLFLIFSVVTIHVLVLIALRKRKNYWLQWIVFGFVLVLHFVVLPEIVIWSMEPPKPNGIECGMPILGIYLFFWIFGTCIAIATAVIGYVIWSSKRNKKSNLEKSS